VGGARRTARFTVTPAADAATGERVRIGATLTTAKGTGTTGRAVDVRAAVTGRPQPLARITEFDEWAARTGVAQLSDRDRRVTEVGSGGSRELTVRVTNTGAEPASGEVTAALPKGFAADRATRPYGPLGPGESTPVTFTVTNTDPSLPTSGEGGEYPYTLTTTSSGAPSGGAADAGRAAGPDVERAAIELVPVTAVPEASGAPTVDGVASEGEYAGAELDLSRLWEGEACASAADCSAAGRVVWHGDALYAYVRVRDDKPGTVLDADDCKRHWRTDSVEIAIDPGGDSENTSTTFKTGILPTTSDGEPCFERDADAHQGPGHETAPGMKVASTIDSGSHSGSRPGSGYAGYTVEAKIPMSALPAPIDPDRMGLNVFAYDSDTEDKTGQTRIGWSTWGGVQGTPWRWGRAALTGYESPDDPATPPVMPSVATRSVDSPESVIQAARTGVPLAAGPPAPADQTARIVGRPVVADGAVTFTLAATGPGTAYAYVWDGEVLGQAAIPVDRPGRREVTLPGARGRLLLAFAAERGGTASQAISLR
jgi:hypothetical protein